MSDNETPTQTSATNEILPVKAATRPGWLLRSVHLFALAGFAVAQPLFGLLGGEPEFWIARDSGPLDVIVLIVVVLFLLPGLVLLVEWVVSLVNTDAAWVVHVVAAGGFFALIALDVIDTVTGQTIRGLFVVLMAAAVGVVLALVYAKQKVVRDFVGILAIGPVIFAVLLVVSLPPLGGTDANAVDVGITSGESVVFVVLDEFQLAAILDETGSVDASRYPNLDRLAAISTWYPNATTVHDNTLKAVPALLSGSFPSNDKQATAADHPVNLFTTLADTHAMRVIEDVTQLCPTSICDEPRDDESQLDHLSTLTTDSAIVYLHTVVPATLRYRLPPIGTRWEGFLRSANDTVAAAPGSGDDERGQFETALGEQTGDEVRSLSYGTFLDSLDPAIGPALYYAHVDLPHAPWSLLDNGKRYPYSDVIPGYTPQGIWQNDEWYVQQAYARYLQTVAFTDSLVGLTLDRLEHLGMLDDTLVIFTSDHGENFVVEESRRAMTDDTLAALAGVPVFIKYPGQSAGTVEDSNAQTVDLLPTVIDVLGGVPPDVFDGRSLRSEDLPDAKRMLTNAGGEFNVGMADYLNLMADHRSEVLSMFPTAGGFGPMFASLGPLPQLNGTAVLDLSVVDAAGSTEISSQSVVDDFDPAGPLDPVAVPFVVTADSGGVSPYFVVAVNGEVLASVTAHLVDGNSSTGYAIVPPNSFRTGQNAIEVFGVDLTGSEPVLIRYG